MKGSESMLKLLNKKTVSIAAVTGLLLSFAYITNDTNANKPYEWEKLGQGNLLVENEGSKTFLRSNETI
jgi:hypothetical protein